ncbi:MAG: tyrosine--tRNA ligase [Alicyclobacillus sp.]|nr:tyrosine--tRNA ligase [Alicyclobacillus sp.]
MNILEDLEFRGLLFQCSAREELERKLAEGPVRLYIGFDPTADSLHIGSLLPILTLRRFQLAGHRPIALVGGATGLIGDPSGRKQERQLNDLETVAGWTRKIQGQLSRFLDFDHPDTGAIAVNNLDWTADLDVITFLRDVGKHFSVNTMLARESVATRLEGGISFTEFSYMLLQAHDFLELYRRHGCTLQVGGSDQWGNIVGGIDLIRRVAGEQVYGLTVPLVTKADGTKFGKTESGAVWLDAEKTSVYQFYQFWLNTPDADVVKFLKYFTFLTPEEIADLEQSVETDPGSRRAQRTLAEQVTTLVHGAAATARAVHLSQVLFSGEVQDLTAAELSEVFADVPSATISASEGLDIVTLLLASGACPSKRQAREDIASGAISVNGVRVTDVERVFGAHDLLADAFLVIRRGKKRYFLLKVE